MAFDSKEIDSYPTKPGVYLMRGRAGKVLYVGKAKNLRQRVKQYFSAGGDERPQIPFLIRQVQHIETILVHSEKEALLLEDTLIKKYQPKYNALLKDDKTYISLVINHKHEWPMVRLVRFHGKAPKNVLAFGPYTSAYAARQVLEWMNKLFPLRQCSDRELRARQRPCILHQMHRCVAPCVQLCSHEEYKRHVQHAIQFLKGQAGEILDELKSMMQEASEHLEFEKAQTILDTIRAIEKTVEQQYVHRLGTEDYDVLGLYREAGDVTLSLLYFRAGKMIGADPFSFGNVVQEDSDILCSFLLQHYGMGKLKPKELFLPLELEEKKILTDVLGIKLHTPIKGSKKQLVAMANENAQAAFERGRDVQVQREKRLLELKERLQLNHFPRHIECFDTSHFGGAEPVASMVAFLDGDKAKQLYRKYRVRTAKASDDYGALYEVLQRRYRKAREEQALPDLIVVDGGKGQLNRALQVLSELDISAVDVIGLAKEEGRHDKGVTQEQIFLPGRKDPVKLRSNHPALFLLQQIRDEAHRFALSYQKKRRSKQVLRSTLDEIPGIGPTKKKSLLSHFGSVKAIKNASLEAILEVQGISKVNAEAIKKYFS